MLTLLLGFLYKNICPNDREPSCGFGGTYNGRVYLCLIFSLTNTFNAHPPVKTKGISGSN